MREKLFNYGYKWLGVKTLNYEYAKSLLQDKGKYGNVLLLYEDDTETELNGKLADDLLELEKHYNNGGLIGTDIKEFDNYVAFILGRDLLKDILPYENDLAYEFCVNVAKDFEVSEFNVNTKGLYGCVVDYINNRFDFENKKFLGIDLEEVIEKNL